MVPKHALSNYNLFPLLCSSSASTGTKKRRSVMISAPIPCNTAFPSDHTSNLGPIQKHKVEEQEKAAEDSAAPAEKASGRPSSSSGEASDPEEPEVNSDGCSDQPAAGSDEEPVGLTHKEEKQEMTEEEKQEMTEEEKQEMTKEEKQEKEGEEEKEEAKAKEENGKDPELCTAQSEQDSTEEGPAQTLKEGENEEGRSGLPCSELGDLPPENDDSRPIPAPRRAEKRISLKLDTNGVEAEPAGAVKTENPPGFLYKVREMKQDGDLKLEPWVSAVSSFN